MNAFLPLLKIVENGTLAVLCLLSVWSVAVMIDRRKVFRKTFFEAEFESAERTIKEVGLSRGLGKEFKESSALKHLLSTLESVPNQTAVQVEAAAKSVLQRERQNLEKGLGVLATLGSNAPFIGLFGTVLGIIEAFGALSANQTSSQAVMGSIAGALIATATGLFVAIPAVVAFNYFSSRMKTSLTRCDALKNLYISRLSK